MTMLREPQSSSRRLWLVGLVSLLVAAAIGVPGQAQARPRTPVHPNPAHGHGQAAFHQQPKAGLADALATRIELAVGASKYPTNLTPTLGDAQAGMARELDPAAQCINPDDVLNTDRCNFGPANAPKTAVVLGDSVAASYLDGIVSALVPAGYRVHGLTISGCPVAYVQVRIDNNPTLAAREKQCNRQHLLLYAQVQRLDPDLLVMSDSASALQRLASGNRGAAAVAEWTRGMRVAIGLLSSPGRKLVTLAPNPVTGNPATCYQPGSAPSDCAAQLSDQPWWAGKRTAESTVAKEYGTVYRDTLGWFCYDDTCPVFEGNLTMHWDGSHITGAYSQMLAPLLKQAILGSSG